VDTIVYGIDLGTTFCACGRIEVGASDPEIVRLEERLPSLASVVTLKNVDGRLRAYVGRDAFRKFATGDVVVEFAKRFIGRPAVESKTWELGRHEFDPVDVSALILRKIALGIWNDRKDDRSPVRAVVTHPRDFQQVQRQATAEAVAAAGIDLIETLNEPEAASYMYFEPGADRVPGKYMVFDLGGGTLDIAILDVPTKGRPNIIGGRGISQLGGKDWDDKLFDEIVRAAANHHRGQVDVQHSLSELSLFDWRQRARDWKEKRGRKSAWQEEVRWRTRDGEEVVTPIEVSCAEWDRACAPLVDQCEQTIDDALRDAGVRNVDIVRVLPVGGSMRLQMVQDMLGRVFGRRVDRIGGPDTPSLDTVVAEGAARYAAYLVGAADAKKGPISPMKRARLEEIEEAIPVSTLAHGINVLTRAADGSEVLSAVVPQNTKLPCQRERTFRVVDEHELVVEIFEGSSGPKPKGVQPSAELVFPSHARPKPGEVIHVEVDVSATGRIKVRARHASGEVVEGELHNAGEAAPKVNHLAPSRRQRLASIEVF
jgi:molecular chaperone DnaK (HSP70)